VSGKSHSVVSPGDLRKREGRGGRGVGCPRLIYRFPLSLSEVKKKILGNFGQANSWEVLLNNRWVERDKKT
jgi:hypothetical protein